MCADRLYQETIDYLFALQKHGIKLGLDNTRLLLELCGNPHRRFRSVHVAGTNGKGSTCAFLTAILSESGLRVGMYTSPHLVDFTERIRINGRTISEARVVELARRIREAYERQPGAMTPTFFEVTTALAFTYFAEEGVDIAVVEVGMGGRMDSTNVITPLVSLITNIDLEHIEFLGNSLDSIAAEKAGIIKPGIPVVTAARQAEALKVIGQSAEKAGSRLYVLGRDFAASKAMPGKKQRFDYKGITGGFTGMEISLQGGYQVENACLALAAMECLGTAGVPVDEVLRRGLAKARWEGRLELVSTSPDLYLDGAHNPASARMLAGAVRQLKMDHKGLVLVLGILGDKDFRGIIRELVPLADRVIVTRPAYSRALDLESLATEVRRFHGSVSIAGSVGDALDEAKEGAGPEEMILVTGSLYVVGDARAALFGDQGHSGALSGLKG